MKHFTASKTALVGALLLGPMLGAGTATPAGATGSTHLLTCQFKTTSEPSSYLLSCADANASFSSMRWSAWGASSARGRGILLQNDCTPNCVSGKVISYATTVTLTKVINTKKYGRLYSEAYFRYTAHGKTVTEKFGLAD